MGHFPGKYGAVLQTLRSSDTLAAMNEDESDGSIVGEFVTSEATRDAVAELASAALGVPFVGPILKTLQFFGQRNTQRLQAAWREEQGHWLVELSVRLKEQGELLERMAANDRTVEPRLDNLTGDRQFQRVLANIGLEARREAMNERRRMLAYAGAGVFNVDLRLADIARVERILRELDPDDILLLQQLAALAPSDTSEDEEERLCAFAPVSAVALDASGCIRAPVIGASIVVTNDHKPGSCVTLLGRMVLQIMRGYVNARAGVP